MGVFLAPRSIYMNPTNMHAAPVVQATTAGARVVLLGGELSQAFLEFCPFLNAPPRPPVGAAEVLRINQPPKSLIRKGNR